ncbi:MAG: PAS domain S-box protein, partial [Bacteroidales bacterium]
LHPNDRDWAVKYCESCTLKGERHRFEYRFRKKDGSYVWLLADVSVELQKGKPIKLWGSMIDITERKQAEELLQKSEEKYRLIFEFSPLGIFYFDEKGIIKACNNNFVNIIGSSQQALVGLDMLKLPDKKIVAALKESLNGNPGFYEGVYKSVTADKATPVRVLFAPVISGSALNGSVGIVEDITERKTAEYILKESERKFSTLLANLPGMSYRCKNDKTRTMEFVSRGVKGLTGYEPYELTDNNVVSFNEVIAEEYRQYLWNKWQEVLKNKEHFEAEYQIITKDGNVKWVWEQGSGIYSDNDEVIALEGFITDITERKVAEEARRISEERFNLSMEATKDGLWDWDIETDYSYFNPAYFRMLDYKPGDFPYKGSSFIKLIHPDDKENVLKVNNDCINGKVDTFEMEFRMQTASKNWIWILSRAKCVKRKKSGKASRIVGTHIDITERKHFIEKLNDSRLKLKEQNTEYRSMNQEYLAINEELNQVNEELRMVLKELEDSNKRNEVLLENAFDGIYLLHGKRFEYVNKQFCKITEYSLEELTDENFDLFKALTDKGKEIIERRYNERLKGNKLQNVYEFQIKTKSGKVKDLEVSTASIKGGDRPKVLGIIRDITKIKKNQQLQQEVQIANKSAEFKQKFLANMSHEIRTPLTGMLGFVELLNNTRLTKTQKAYLETLRHSGENLKEIINLILDYSKIESGEVSLKPIAFPSKSIFEKVANLFSSICHKQVDLITYIDRAIPDYIKTDQPKLNQILNNLASNAVKFTEKGKIELSAKLENLKKSSPKLVKPDIAIIKIEVKDTGIGISPDAQKHLFQPFSQVENNAVKYIEGTGLGLSICKELSEILGGQIGVDSKEGEGSNFWFTFKADIAKKNEVMSEDIIENYIAKEVKSLNILLVEDKKVNQMVVSIMLESMGHKVDIANNGLEVLDNFKADFYDLVLMDIQMPVMDGITATKKLKQKYKNLPPIVGLSANAFEGDREKYMREGMDEYLIKPIKSKDFERLLKKLGF